MANVNLKINGKAVSVPAGTTVLEAAKAAGVTIPTLCAYEGMGPHAACRLCVVEVAGEAKEKLACAVKVSEGMDVTTDSPALFELRKAAVTEMFRQAVVINGRVYESLALYSEVALIYLFFCSLLTLLQRWGDKKLNAYGGVR